MYLNKIEYCYNPKHEKPVPVGKFEASASLNQYGSVKCKECIKEAWTKWANYKSNKDRVIEQEENL